MNSLMELSNFILSLTIHSYPKKCWYGLGMGKNPILWDIFDIGFRCKPITKIQTKSTKPKFFRCECMFGRT